MDHPHPLGALQIAINDLNWKICKNMSGLIWIQTVSHSDGIPESFFSPFHSNSERKLRHVQTK